MQIPLSLPMYPLPVLDNPYSSELKAATDEWIDLHYQFLSVAAREKYKRMQLSQFASRCYPHTMSYAHLKACCRITLTATIMDDYYEHCTAEEIQHLRDQVMDVFNGSSPASGDNGIIQQMAVARDELQELMPAQWMDRFIEHTDWFIGKGMKAECFYVLHKKVPGLKDYLLIREQSIGSFMMSDLVEVALGFALPRHIARHPFMQQLTSIVARIKAWLNDLASSPKDLSRESEVMNLVLVLQQEYGLTIEEAYAEARRFHDKELDALLALQETLPDFDIYAPAVRNYIDHQILMMQGESIWYAKDTLRYSPGGYAEPEYRKENNHSI